MRLFFSVFIVTVTVCVSCSSPEYFPVTKVLNGKTVQLEEYFGFPRIDVFDTILVIADHRNDPSVFIYQLPSFKLIANVGKKGRGPGELLAPSGIDIENTHRIWIYDFSRLEFTAFDPDSVGAVQTVKLPAEESPPHVLYANFISEREYAIYRPDLKDGIFRLYQDGQCIKALGKLPPQKSDVPDHALFQAYIGLSEYNSNLNKMVVAYMYTNKIDIIDMKTDSITTVLGKNFFEPIYDVSPAGTFTPNERTVLAYRGIDIDDQYIYVLYEGSGFTDAGSKELHVFDWTGSPVCRYILNYETTFFAVDSKNRKIYTMSPETDNSPVVYDMDL